jgi:pimeloyl-ACP methyl ester carboxylesterase
MTRKSQLASVARVVGDRYRTEDVPVRGGSLRVGVWEPVSGGAGAPTVVAVHGITSSHLAWPLLTGALPDVRVVAPDLRGRGRSSTLPGPFGMPTHADDVVAAMDALEVERAVLVDGGMPLLPPEGVTPDQLAQAVLGPAAARLQMEFPDRGAYQQFFRNHPAFVDAWSDLVTAYVDYDLVGEEPHLRPATSVEALQEDIRELVDGQSLLRALANLRHEAAWLVAPRGLLNEVPPLYPDAAREHWLTQHPQLELAEVPDVNHYTVVMHQAGMNAVAPWVERALGR